ncbi:MAG TPA: hypothetical protein VLA99_02785 [Nitrospiraceae bacterium]|nr:hypothetical protein [Nitrospiraceae bacterium]
MADEMTLDEAIGALAALEREERRKWNAVTRLRDALAVAQAVRDAEGKLQSQLDAYQAKEAAMVQEYETRLADITKHRRELEAEYATWESGLREKQKDVEAQVQQSLEETTKRHKKLVSEMEGHARKLSEDQDRARAEWAKEQEEMRHLHKQAVEHRQAEIADLDQRVTYLKEQLAAIQKSIMGPLEHLRG